MDIKTIKKKLETHKDELASRFGIREIGVFGSYAKGKQKKRSDVDILVRYGKIPGFFDYIRAESYLSKLLGTKVDLVIDSDLNPIIARKISNEVVRV